jgi:predicted double-glycine peptidase
MKLRHTVRYAALISCMLVIVLPSHSGNIPVPPRGVVHVPVTSYAALKFRNVERQHYDFSCGSAALATLLSYHYDDAANEATLFNRMYARGDQQKIQREGFSLLDVKRELEVRGYRSDGFRMTLSRWRELRIPALVLINDQGYSHFVVLKGARGDQLLVADPARGNRTIGFGHFTRMWNGIAFMIRDHSSEAAATFNREADWMAQPRAPIGSVLAAAELRSIHMLRAGAAP